MNENEFKKKNKYPSCNSFPAFYLIPFDKRQETLRAIKQESIDLYGEDLTGVCPKAKVCSSLKACQGRPLPMNSSSALPYLEKLAKSQIITNGELFITGCNGCSIANQCSKTCSTINDFINRGKSEGLKLSYFKDYSTSKVEVLIEEPEKESINLFNSDDIPWDVLPKTKIDIIKIYLYEQRDFKYIADKLSLTNAAYAKYQFYASLNKLSEYGVFRKFLSESYDQLTYRQYSILNAIYNENKSLTEVAKQFKINVQAVSNMVARIIKLHNIKVQKFVVKKNNKPIYSSLELFK